MNITERNEHAKQFIIDKLDLVSTLQESDFQDIEGYQEVCDVLKNLIDVKPMGFRGVVATAITGKFLNPEYDPLNNFYSCKPRSIFEQGIFYAFQNRIPCGKSDPLNVAKNINVLDDEWAKGKRPQTAAQAVVDYLRIIEKTKNEEPIINFFFFKLSEYAKKNAAISIEIPKEQNLSSQLFASKITRFVLEYPESGTIPQFIISKLLSKHYDGSDTMVIGGSESVFGTNTTSKKPADVWLEKNNIPTHLYEITVKKIDYKRLDDSLQSLNAMKMLDVPIHFICRIPDDVNTLGNVGDNFLKYKDKTFNFVDISSFINTLSSFLSGEQIDEIMDDLAKFVQLVNRPTKTKIGWREVFL